MRRESSLSLQFRRGCDDGGYGDKIHIVVVRPA